jgi:hypothetical protein
MQGGFSMLFDMVGILIGFVTVMLVLSLMVTALVQLVQNLFSLRFRNLRRGLEVLIPPEAAKTPQEKRDIANRILERPITSQKAVNKFMNPTLSWIKAEEFIKKLGPHDLKLSETKVSAIKADFDNLENYLSKRFQLHIKIISIICAVVVAFVFQVNTLDLLKKLSVSPELRAKYLETAQQLVDKEEPTATQAPSYNYVSDRALEIMQNRHPELSAPLEEAGGLGKNRAEILSEFNTVLVAANVTGRTVLAQEYSGLLDSLYKADALKMVANVVQYSDKLALIDITIWPGGWAFYSVFDHWIGFIIAIIMLTIGAPFWFDMLKNLLKLGDALKPKKEGSENKP